MIIVSYDIKDDKIRTKFAKMLCANGAIRLQFSVYEVNNTQRVIDNIKVNIVEKFSNNVLELVFSHFGLKRKKMINGHL